MMRYFLVASLLVFAAIAASGCILPAYSSDPQVRIQEEMNDSENLRQVDAEWRRFWMNDKPSSLTQDRLSGMIM
jgi:hypothetical protein